MTNTRRIQDNQQNQEQQNQNDYYYNNNYYHTEPGVLCAEQMEMIREAYEENIGRMTAASASIIEKALQNGLKPDEIVMACEETGLASRPSGYYLAAVLRNWAENGVTVSRVRNKVQPNEGRKWWKS